MGNLGFQEILLILVTGLIYLALPIVLIIILIKTFQNTKSLKETVMRLEMKMEEMEKRLDQ